jgi:hypothetical protein
MLTGTIDSGVLPEVMNELLTSPPVVLNFETVPEPKFVT